MNFEKLISETARKTIQIEKETIANLSACIDQEFCRAVEVVFQSQGKLIITGIGKSAIIGQKIVATLNSTGTPSVFMHAADAIHGDLGIILPQDMVLCISKSGETPEIKVLVPLLKNLGNTLIGMVSNRNSFLGKHANFVLHTPVSKEADPNNLAPTASTTAQIAMGDAFATALLALRGFTPRDFAQFHPGGTLGKQLYLTVADLYPQHECPIVRLDATISAVIMEMTSKRLGATAVTDHAGQVIGIITDGDLRRMLNRAANMNELQAKDIMTANPKTIPAKALAVKALELMRNNSITQLVVMDNERYVGMIHIHDLIKEGLF